eukprot:TRINITY_DN1389_c0_g1_i1.p1 TRINITY_DN1389_c0_g1~~TRINITY_DN1389_c0_g1_i1.p1  ORF type:complete len:55 (-),score=1.32 TRINITY_DN1389_c0_g1_i1:537-701(-)
MTRRLKLTKTTRLLTKYTVAFMKPDGVSKITSTYSSKASTIHVLTAKVAIVMLL